MKKYVKKNRNRKGSVLLTVMCFTVVCMIIATTALSLAAYAAKQSNKNVKSTQAEISAQDYLEEFLKTFATYDDLEAMANTNTTVNVSMTSSSATPNVGNCSIQIKNKSTGILVTSTVDYAGETESVSAFFDGQAPSNFDSTNVIETSEGSTGDDRALVCEGDALIEDSTATITDRVVYFHNDQSDIKGNYITQCSLIAGYNTNTTITETTDGKAPIVIANGYLFWGQTKINSGVVKKSNASGVYDNTDGYVLTNSKFIALGNKEGQIGEVGKPIDVYCYGAWFGKVTDSAITGLYPDTIQAGPCPKIYGNMYCYTGSGSGQDGDLYVNCLNADDAYIKGDLYVKGDIYLASRLDVYGNLYCNGTIYAMDSDGNVDSSSSITINSDGTLTSTSESLISKLNVTGSYSNTLPSDTRATMPETYTSASHVTDSYSNDGTPNRMYQQSDTNPAAKDIKAKYQDAYGTSDDEWDVAEKVLDNVYIDSSYSTSLYDFIKSKYSGSDYTTSQQYLEDSTVMNQVITDLQNNSYFTLYAKGNCYISKSILSKCYNQFDNVKIQIEVQSDDIVVLLDKSSTSMDIAVKYTGPKNTVNENGIFTDVPKNFCYFMLACGKDANYYKDDHYINNNTSGVTWDFTQTSIYNMDQYASGAEVLNATATKDRSNNNFILAPDDCCIRMKAQNTTCIQAIIYGPQATLNVTGTGSAQRVFIGQAFVKSFETDQNDARVASQLAAPDSILGFINTLTPTNAIKLKYFTKRSN